MYISVKIFEFQFNPKAKSDRFFRVFSFPAPKEMLDRGDMYILGELKNALPVNANFLDQLATLLSKEYYDAEKPNLNASHRLKNALKKGNSFLEEETKKGNVDWLGNLHLLLLLFVPGGQGYTLYFTKVGGMKLWLSRSGSLVDAGKSIDGKKEDEESVKVFGNVGSGRVIPQDRIVALTQELFEFFSKENFLQTITQFKEEKQFKNAFKEKEKEMSLLSGALLFTLVEAAQVSTERNPVPRLRVPSLGAMPKIKLPAVSLTTSSFIKKKWAFITSISNAKKRMGIIALFVCVLFVGFAIFGAEQQKKEDAQEEVVKQAEMTEEERILNKIIDIAEPEVVAEFPAALVAENPQRMAFRNDKFYFFGPSSSRISVFDSAEKTFQAIGAGKNIKFGTSVGNSLLLFGESNAMFTVDEQHTVIQSTVASFPADFQLGAMEQFAGSLYFLDSRTGEILKSRFLGNVPGSPESWLDPLSSKKPINAQGMSIDGNIWILGAGKEISRYYKGSYQETLHITISPAFQGAVSLKTVAKLPYLYMLEPGEKRIVVLDKSGVLIQQYHSSAFAQTRDFAVSPDGQTIYLFDGVKLYRVLL